MADINKLEARIDELEMSRNTLEWYLDLRRFGSDLNAPVRQGRRNSLQFHSAIR